MRWPNFVRLTLEADDLIADRKEQKDRADRERAMAAQPGGGWRRA